MTKFIKCFIVSLLISVFLCLNTYAEDTVSLDLGKNFLVYPRDNAALCEVFNTDKDALNRFCTENDIIYLASDQGNSRQIRVQLTTNNFSNSIVNLSELSNDKIQSLAEDVTGISGINGEVIIKNGQKFLKTQQNLEDSGGKYILTQYFTVADRKNITLSFYSSNDINIDYISEIFDSYTSPLFINEETKESDYLSYVIPVATVLLAIVCVILGFSIVKDLKNSKSEDIYYGDESETEENEINN